MRIGTPRSTFLALPLAACLLVGCKTEELDRARQETLAAKSESAARAAEVERLDANVKEISAKLETAEKELAARKEELEKVQKELKDVDSHRDELVEWIEADLLPVAEKHDPKLANLRDAATEMAAEVERLRGLKFKRPFMRRLVTREHLGAFLRRSMDEDMSVEDERKFVAVGAEFGLVKPGTSLRDTIAELGEGGVAGLYNPATGIFYLIEGNDGRGARPIVFHELVHALEDQYFGLDQLQKAADEDSERGLALKGLVEGSASLFQDMYQEEHPEDFQAMMKAQMSDKKAIAAQMKMMSSVPPVVIAMMAFYPYNNAKDFLAKIGADTPEEIERLYRDPPVSTEQILHPEKFPLDGARDYPHVVAAPAVGETLGEGWEEVDTDSMGEMVTGILLSQLQWKTYAATTMSIVSPTGALMVKAPYAGAAAGWDGDQYAAWREVATDRVAIVWTSVWDSEKDAQEFADVYAKLLGKRVLGTKYAGPVSPVRYAHDPSGAVTGIDVRGNRVTAILSAPADKAESLMESGFAAAVTPDARDAADTPAGK